MAAAPPKMNSQPSTTSFPAPVHCITPKLNFDVLSTIFGFCHVSPWILVQIDRLWRTRAFSMPSLWSYIRVTGLRTFHNRYVTDAEICNTPTRLEAALKRVGNAPIHLYLDLFIDGLNEASQNILRAMI